MLSYGLAVTPSTRLGGLLSGLGEQMAKRYPYFWSSLLTQVRFWLVK